MKYKLLFLALGLLTSFQLFATPGVLSFYFSNSLANSSTIAVPNSTGETLLNPFYEFSRTATGATYENVSMSVQLILNTAGVEEVLGESLAVTNNDFDGAFTISDFPYRIKSITVSNQKLLGGRLQLKYRYLDYTTGVWVENQKSTVSYGTQIVANDLYPNDFVQFTDDSHKHNKYNITGHKPLYSVPPANAWFPSETTPVMRIGGKLLSNNGQYALNFQADGNLVLVRESNGAVLWSIQQQNGTYLMFHKDGNLLMHTNSGYNWTSDIYVAGKDYQNTGRVYIVLQDDGNLVMEWNGGNFTDVIGATGTGGGIVSSHFGSMKLPKI